MREKIQEIIAYYFPDVVETTNVERDLYEVASVAERKATQRERKRCLKIIENLMFDWDKPIEEIPNEWYHHNEALKRAKRLIESD